jgi:hypothetical protein
MRAYLGVSGTLFGLAGILQLLRVIDALPRWAFAPWFILATAVEALAATALSIWAWRLFRRTAIR